MELVCARAGSARTPAGPARVRIPASSGVGRNRRDAGRLQRIQDGVRHGDIGGLVASAQPDTNLAESRQLDLDAVPVPAQERRRPDLATTAWWKEERGERVFVDYNRMARDQTIASAYSVRARPTATVSAPLT